MKHAKLRSFTFILVAFMLGCNEFMVVGVLSDIARSYHVPLSTVGFLVTAFAGVYAISTPIITTLTSNWNRYKLLMLLMTVFFIGNTLTAMAPTLGWLLFARIITAAVAGTIISLINLLVSIITPMDKRPMVLAWVGAGFSIASVIGVPLGTTIATLLSWHDSFWIISGLTLIVFALLAWLTPRDTPQVKGSILEQLALLKDHRVLLGIGITVAVLSLQYTFYTYVRPLITTVMGFSLTSLNWLLLLLGVMNIIGNVEGKTAVIVDDIVDTAGSLVEGARALEKMGAKEVYACCTHGIMSDPATERVQNSCIKELIITNSIPLAEEKKIDKIKCLSVAEAFAEGIACVYEKGSISKLFQK